VPANHPGSCQGCFKQQKTRDGRLVLHGYKRPGHGYIIGNCWGHGYAPFEVSCERTKEFIAKALKPALASAQERLVRLRARPERIFYLASVWVGYNHPKAARRSGYAEVRVELQPGQEPGYVETEIVLAQPIHYSGDRRREAGERNVAHHPGYERALEGLIGEAEREVKHLEREVSFFEAKVRSWAPQPWPAEPVGLEASCEKCGETFNPSGAADLEHGQRQDGEECGGRGILRGAWA
jgi:hypothetical protein